MALQFSSSHGKILRSSRLSAVIFSRQILNGQKFTCVTYLHGTMQILLQIAAMFTIQKLSRFWFSILRLIFSVLTSRNKEGNVTPKLLNVILLLITIFTFKWCREISFESYHGSMILTNLSQLSSESLSVKFTQKVYWSVWKHTVDKLDNYIHSNELWESRSLCTEKSVGCITGPFH